MRIHRHRNRKPKFDIPKFRVNEKITSPEVRVIGPDGAALGVLPTTEAIRIAQEEHGMDLIEVSPKAEPPVTRILDHGTFKYQKEKEAKKQRAQSKAVEIKGIRLSMKIGKNDMTVRVNQALKFLEKGNKIRVEMILRGREKAHLERADIVFNEFLDQIKGTYDVKIESPVKRQHNKMHMIVARNS